MSSGCRPAYGACAAAHHLYRAFDAAGVLLYVGLSRRPRQRLVEHSRTAAWWPLALTFTVHTYEGCDAAAEAERRAIAGEGPLHNKIGGKHFYLAERPEPVEAGNRLTLADLDPALARRDDVAS